MCEIRRKNICYVLHNRTNNSLFQLEIKQKKKKQQTNTKKTKINTFLRAVDLVWLEFV